MSGVVIIGAGHGGANAAAFLRQFGYEGDIVLVSDEARMPYHRPPLSKVWLKGEAKPESLLLRPAGFYEKSNITLKLGHRVTSIDSTKRQVVLDDAERLGYDHLILATGARARKLTLPGSDLALVHELRHAADAERLRDTLTHSKRIAIVGGGYIGLEVAASARALGVDVVVLEREARVLARVANPVLSEFFTAYHRSHNVDIRTGVDISAFETQGVRLADGTLVEADAILVGIGAVVNDELARGIGLECEPAGIRVDESARTSDPAIFAIGDVTSRPMPLYGRRGRLESVPNAIEQAKQAAAAIAGKPVPAPEVPWFWSDQYDAKLQIAGLVFGGETLVVRGDPAAAKFALFHLLDGKVGAVEAINAAAEFMMAKQWILAGTPIDAVRLADIDIPVKEIAA